MSKTFAISIIQTLRQQGFQAYLAGGCVRDRILGVEPKDFDVATSKSFGVLSSKRSRTHPPTRNAAWPDCRKRSTMASANDILMDDSVATLPC